MTPKITHVEARKDYKLYIEFENGEARLFDVAPYLDKGVFRELRSGAYFKRVRPVWGGIEWPHEQDLSSDTLYCAGVPVEEPGRTTASRRSGRSEPMIPRAARAN
jgi:hypothetical protein